MRLHSTLGYRPPEEFEQAATPGATSQGATLRFFTPGALPDKTTGLMEEGAAPPPPYRLPARGLAALTQISELDLDNSLSDVGGETISVGETT